MKQLVTLNSKDFNKGIFYFSEYYFLNDEINLNNLLKKADFLRKKFNVKKFILIGYFDQEQVMKFFSNDFCKACEKNIIDKSSVFDEVFENDLESLDFQFALIDYFNLDNAHKYLGSSNFFLVLDKNNKILFSTKKYIIRYLMKIFLCGLGLSASLLYIFSPSIENIFFIEKLNEISEGNNVLLEYLKKLRKFRL